MTEGEKSLIEEFKELKIGLDDVKNRLNSQKEKKYSMPWAAKVGKSKLKKGYVTCEITNENKDVVFKKLPILLGVIKDGDTYHYVKEGSVYTHRGRPFVRIIKNKIDTHDPLAGDHETRGQKHVMTRMITDAIKEKKGLGGMGWWIFLLLIIGAGAYYFMKARGAA